jgi:hypothetical protein
MEKMIYKKASERSTSDCISARKNAEVKMIEGL